jgi:hypothetical protein
MHCDRYDRFDSGLNICLEDRACCYWYGDRLLSSAILIRDFFFWSACIPVVTSAGYIRLVR